MNLSNKHIYIIRLLSFLTISYFCAYYYIDTSSDWTKLARGLSTFNSKIFIFELPLFVLVSVLFYIPKTNNHFIRILIPPLVLYGLFDGFYHFLNRSPTLSDFQNLWDIAVFSPKLITGLITIILFVLLSFIISMNIQLKQENKTSWVRLLSIKGASVVIITLLLSSSYFINFHQTIFVNSVWAHEDTIRENGRFNSFIYFSNQERVHASKLNASNFKDENINILKSLYPGKIKQPSNIHMIVMESFIDPRLIKELDLPSSVLAKELIPYLGEQQQFSMVTSPIYGGGTAQSEFELLTGIKAFSLINQIEFNVMQGNKINSFISHLSQIGYKNHATIAPSSHFFNSTRAYKSLGFEHVSFLQDEKTKLGLNTNNPIFDGDLFEQNIDYLNDYLSNNKEPIFNYVLGMYGHLPFDRDLDIRPDVVTVEHSDKRFQPISNQFYYRTKALAEYLNQLMLIDPYSIIVIVSDHLPSVLSQSAHYPLNNKENISLFFNQGKYIDISGNKHYQIPWLIWDQLTEQSNSRELVNPSMQDLYFKALSESQK